MLVDDIYPYHQRLLAAGADIFFGPVEVPTGACFNARLPDGTIIEYVHHRPRADE
ncbi:VOC family protein [Serratia marcescens]